MSAGTTNPDETTRIEDSGDGYFIDKIEHIDLSDLDFDHIDDWLYMPMQCSTESITQDLHTWLKTEPEVDVQNGRQCINSRTFTRPKKRSSRASFESVSEGSPLVTNVWKSQNPDLTHIEDVEEHLPIKISAKESIPPMLVSSFKATKNMLSNDNLMLSGQESMEAFLNMSQSKGIDSFINLGEPEFNDLLMNVSQPSILHTSIVSSTNDPTLIKNDIAPVTNKDIAIHKMVHQSNSLEKIPLSCNIANETFITSSADKTIIPNRTYCTSSLNSTFCKEIVQPNRGLNETYDAKVSNEVSASISDRNDKTDITILSSTAVIEPNIGNNLKQLENNASNNISLNTTYTALTKCTEEQDVLVNSDMHANKNHVNISCNISSNENDSAAVFQTTSESGSDTCFKVPIYDHSTPKNPDILNATKFTIKPSDQQRQVAYLTFKAPTSLRRELLAEIQRGEHKLDSTYDHIPNDYPNLRDIKEYVHIPCDENVRDNTNIVLENKYHTYKKTLTTNEFKNQNKRDTAPPVQSELQDRRFYTFTKKSNNLVKKTENVEVPADMDGTFCKPLPKTQKRNLYASRIFGNSLKTTNIPGCTNISSIRYMKGSQPNLAHNVEKSLSKKLHPFGQLKSGSEQQLLKVGVNRSEFQAKDKIGSTESVESIQSAHSAPDLDDRLSIDSDSSHSSCNKHPMNIEHLHQLVRMQEESLKQDSVSKPNARILKNTWIEGKADLPSPILKNGTENCKRNTTSSVNSDSYIKSSSPIMSPTGSSHVLNNDGNIEENINKNDIAVAEKKEDLNQIVPKVENKTRLRQPTNWNTGSKSSTVISGIPRPASRIPALRFARPNVKAAQPDLRKGYM